MNEAMKNLLERRSVRGYKKDLVPAEVLDEILEWNGTAENTYGCDSGSGTCCEAF